MFVDILTYEEKEALFQLIASIAKADDNFTEEETDYLSIYAQDNGVIFDINSDINTEQACSKLQSHNAKTVAIQEIIRIAVVDGHYDDSERLAIVAIADLLEMDLDKFEEIENWVIEGQNWVERGENMLNLT